MVQRAGLQSVIVAFSSPTHLLFSSLMVPRNRSILLNTNIIHNKLRLFYQNTNSSILISVEQLIHYLSHAPESDITP